MQTIRKYTHNDLKLEITSDDRRANYGFIAKHGTKKVGQSELEYPTLAIAELEAEHWATRYFKQ